MQRRVENVFTTDKLKSNSKFYGGRLELFWWPFTFFVEKAIIAIVHSYSLVAMHFALAPLQFALTMNILGSVGGNLWSKPWKFMKSGWNIAPLRHMKNQRWEDRDTSFSKLAPSGALIAIPTYYWSTTPPPTFSDHTGPQHWTFTFWALQLYKGYNAI